MNPVLWTLVFTLLQSASTHQVYSGSTEVMPSKSTAALAPTQPSTLASDLLKGAKPKWIWGADEQKDYTLSTSVEIANPKATILRASGDNEVTIRINGKRVGQSSEWQVPIEADVTSMLRTGSNTIEADVANQGGVAGFVFKLLVEQADGKRVELVSDDKWTAKTASVANAPVKAIANYGGGPWGDVLANSGQNSDRDVFNALPGFQVERLFRVPRDELGSWVCITTDNRGRLIASDQGNQGLVRITPAPIGSDKPTTIEKLKIDITSAQGLLYAFDSLYVVVNGDKTGLYRLRDTNGDDQFDEKTTIATLSGGGEHGPHAIRLSPDGKSIVLVAGNHTPLPAERKLAESHQTMANARDGQLHATLPSNMTSRIAPNWDEDVLPTRLWDANGHATGIYAPGGWIAQIDPEGKRWEILSVGYRNQYDFDYNADGEMFVYDSDMEWDMGTSWYRPTRVVHASSGSEFGWRSGTACWPTNYVDSLPSLVDVGPGSPVGVSFGYGAKFPAKYQKALFICDWTFGTMYAIHMTPDGSSYKAQKEEFLSRTPLPLTDVLIGSDGAMYFTVGGRGTQSELYRVTYVGTESISPATYHDASGDELRKLRHSIEAYHHENTLKGDELTKAIGTLVPHLSHSDRYIRYAARVALERMPVDSWIKAATQNKSPVGLIEAVVGIARAGETSHRDAALAALARVEWGSLSDTQKVDMLRAYELVLIRLGKLSDAQRWELIPKFETLFLSSNELAKRETAILLVHLDAPSAPSLIVPLLNQSSKVETLSTEELLARNRGYGSSIAAMLSNQPDLQQVHYAFVLREQRAGWTIDLRKQYFEWFVKAQKWSGGNSYQKFLLNISNDAFKSATDQDRLALEVLGLRTPPQVPKQLPKPAGPGKDYNVDELLKVATSLKGRNFENGKKMYAAARCVVCHRFGGDGGSTGPDLTQAAGRFAVRDLIEAIVEPSKVISDQYKTIIVTTDEGDNVSGRVVADLPKELILVTDPEDSTKTVTITKESITGQKTSTESVMPRGLLKELNEQEALDLLAYLLARGNASDPMFR